MKAPVIDAGRLNLLLTELRLPATKLMWPRIAEKADKEGWPAARFLAAFAEHELAERDRCRIERHLAEARLLPGKTLETFELEALPMISKAQVMAVTAVDRQAGSGRQPADVRPARRRQESPRFRHRPRSDREWMARALNPGPRIPCRNSRSRVANSAPKPPSTGSTDTIC